MDEASRFLRYVMPGLSFVAQTILLLWVLLPLGLASELRICATTPVSALL